LEAVVLHAMRRYPENRYASAEDLLADLGRYQSLDGRTYDLAPEKPMGSLMAGGGGKGFLSKVFKNRGGG
jgi:hypothetical protein